MSRWFTHEAELNLHCARRGGMATRQCAPQPYRGAPRVELCKELQVCSNALNSMRLLAVQPPMRRSNRASPRLSVLFHAQNSNRIPYAFGPFPKLTISAAHALRPVWALCAGPLGSAAPSQHKAKALGCIAQKLQRRAQENTCVSAQTPAAFPGVTAASCHLCRAEAPSSLRRHILLQMAWQLRVPLRQLHTRRLQPFGEHSLAPERAWR